MIRYLTLFGMIAAATPAIATDYNFCWVGGGGYTMTGQMRVPDSKMTNAIITEKDVTAFKITGFHHGERLGSWNMSQREANDTWHLRFDPITLTFLTGGSFATTRSQGWNADGTAANCGASGFGFNSGNQAQDICLNNTYISASSIPPETPLIASTAPVEPSCGQIIPLGKRQINAKPLDGESPRP